MVTPVDLSSLGYILPVLAYLIVAVISFSVFAKFKFPENVWWQVFLALFIAAIFVSAPTPRQFVLSMIPLFAIMLVSLFLIMAVLGFMGGMGKFGEGINKGFAIAILIVFVITFFFIFSSYIGPYLPGGNSVGADPNALRLLDWIYAPRVAGAIVLIVVSGFAAWFLVHVKK